jgi:hypothetical protein
MTTRRTVVAVLAATALSTIGLGVGTASADGDLTFNGQGLNDDGSLETEICGVENGAEVDGGYLLLVLTANRATSAEFAAPGDTGDMEQSGNGAFKYVYTGSSDPADLVGVATASYTGTARGNPQFVLSHGCLGGDPPS